ncbi:fumarylacetoacetate hydrolase family protein [Jiella avicenniae]|uniref:Fumarylacetoacetate hydrolase family protein n=1 Tax=Jiella avicenniae TaxID=2907202 RepID=A0A9X1TA65_9HYPH|nr:fumarylacetoacetate hydrolase family protein [Jiella avicenniae]MCE7026953.1 fumarylacetoacetate hydrolase family protein [Jiella avicenniae]
MAYAFPPAWIPTLPIRGSSDEFPVRRIYCVGRNYAEHAVEMGHDPDKEPPFFFQKNPDNLAQTGEFPYPGATKDVHHEIELVAALSKGGTDIAPDAALDHVFGYAVGLDMTRRDLQAGVKKLGRPWEIAKAFEKSAPISEIVLASAIGHPSSGAISLAVNGKTRQSGDLSQMIWKTGEIIAHLSGLFELAPGDLIMTGTPAGVGAVARGDRLEGTVEGVGTLVVTVV